MGKSKRDSASLDYDEPSKRPRYSGHAPPKDGTQGRIDPTYGQRSAFPGLDEEGGYTDEDGDLDYGDDAGAISYLRAVRSEAAGIPTVLVAPKPILEGGEEEDRTIYDDGVGDSRGFYSDGAYTAAPDPQPDTPTDIPPAKHLRTKYFEKILERFGHLREQLGNTPPDHVVEKLDQNHDSYMSASAPDYRKWRWRVINTEPMNAQLARMDRSTSLKLLRLLTNDKLAMGGSTVPSERLSRWIWGVLARLPDSGELNSEEIGLVRDLGKRAVWLGVVMNQPQSDTAARMPGDEDNDGEENYGDEEEDREVGNDFPISKPQANDVSGEVVEDRTEVGAHEPDVYDPQGNIFVLDPQSTESEAMHSGRAKAMAMLADSFWGDAPSHIQSQFKIDVSAPIVAYKGHLPNPEIYNEVRMDNLCILTKKDLRATERLRNFYKRNRGFARSRFPFRYRRNPLAEQYDGPSMPRFTTEDDWDERFMDFCDKTPHYIEAFGKASQENSRDTPDDKYGDEAFDKAWQVAGLDTPQTRLYDDGQDEEEEIAMEKLGLVAGRDPRPAVVRESKPEEKGEEETLEVARARIFARLGGAGDTDAAELAQAREALKEQESKERAREDEEDAARLLNAKATVDMIITVAGEIYGQRDLLEFRESWD